MAEQHQQPPLIEQQRAPAPGQINPQQPDPAYHPQYPEGPNDCRGGCGIGKGHGGGINPNTSTPAIPIPPLRVLRIWCEICRAECNTLEMLEQHKNGKRHKKTARRYEEMQKQQKIVAEYQANSMPGTIYTADSQQANAMPDTKLITVHSSSVIDNAPSMAKQEKVLPTPDVPSTQLEPVKASETTCNNAQVDDPNKSYEEELEQKGNVATAEGTAEVPNNQIDGRQGVKRKVSKNDQVGKKPKKSKRCLEPQRICTVCNVICGSVVAFDAHIAGKKHISKLRLFQQPGAVFGPLTVYIPPDQPIANPTHRPDPLLFGLSSCQMVGQVQYSTEGARRGNIENQDAPLAFAREVKNELENNVINKVTNCAARESDSKETDNMLLNDAISAEIVGGSEVGDTLKAAEDFALDSVSKEKDNKEEIVGGSESEEKLILKMGKSKENSVEIAVGAEVPALDFELKERSISEMGDTSKVPKILL